MSLTNQQRKILENISKGQGAGKNHKKVLQAFKCAGAVIERETPTAIHLSFADCSGTVWKSPDTKKNLPLATLAQELLDAKIPEHA